jgi:hypothetical protein
MLRKCEYVNLFPRSPYTSTRSDNKVRELATVCLPWQQWTETSVSFDDVGVSAFHTCVVADLWQSHSECVYYSLSVFWCLASQQCTCSHGTVREFFASKQTTVLEHPPYSPDLAPSYFLLLPKIKELLKGRH